MARRKQLTEEQKQQAAERDKNLKNAAKEALDDAEFVARMNALAGQLDPDSNFARYSDFNKALFLIQALDLGITPTGRTKTLPGWRNAGRRVRKGSTGIRICFPRTKDDETLNAEREQAKATGSAEPSEVAGAFLRAVFDEAQTDPEEQEKAA